MAAFLIVCIDATGLQPCVLLYIIETYAFIHIVKPRKLNILQEVAIAMSSLANAFITMGLFKLYLSNNKIHILWRTNYRKLESCGKIYM